MPSDKVFSIRFPSDLEEWIVKEEKSTGKSPSEIIRTAIELLIKGDHRQKNMATVMFEIGWLKQQILFNRFLLERLVRAMTDTDLKALIAVVEADVKKELAGV